MSTTIQTLEDLRQYLRIAIQLEHATIPPYLTALYSIHPQTNSDAAHILRVVAVEEMLHLTLAANILTAVGGHPNLSAPGFVPPYPTRLPDGEVDFEVDLQRFSEKAIDNFLQIERVGDKRNTDAPVVQNDAETPSLCHPPGQPGLKFYSIGEFYAEIVDGLERLHARLGPGMFSGDPSWQVTSEYYYSGGASLFPVTDLHSAVEAAKLISGQGEGLGGGIYNDEGELAHFYRFQQLKLGRYYQKGDEPGHPTGPPLEVRWDEVYPIKTNARLHHYPEGSELRLAAWEFNDEYSRYLALLTVAFNGKPQLLLEAVPAMFRIRNKATQLMHNPIPGLPGVNAAPTFELGPRPAEKKR